MNAAAFVQAGGQSIFSSTLCQLVLYTSPGPHTAQGSLVLENEDLKPKRSFTQTSSKPVLPSISGKRTQVLAASLVWQEKEAFTMQTRKPASS